MACAEANVSTAPVLEWALAMLGSRVLFSGTEVGLFTELARRPAQAADEIAEALGLHPRLVPGFLDTLTVMGLLQREQGRYRNGPAAEQFLDAGKPAQYLGGFLDFARDMLTHRVTRLTGALRSGLPQGPGGVITENLRELYANPAVVKGWAEATTIYSMDLNRALAGAFPWQDHTSLTDVGCAGGAVLVQILLRHPHLTGVGFDLPEMRPAFEDYLARSGLRDRARFRGGDFFTDPMPEAEVITLGLVLADFDDAQRKQILARAYAALPAGGTVLIYSLVPDQRPRDLGGLYKGLLLGLTTAGGGTYSAAEAAAWLAEAGFTEIREQPLHQATTLITGRRR